MNQQRFFSAMSRWMAFFVGIAPTEVWSSFRSFQNDCDALVEFLELLTNEAKPLLEERARATKQGS